MWREERRNIWNGEYKWFINPETGEFDKRYQDPSKWVESEKQLRFTIDPKTGQFVKQEVFHSDGE